MAKMRFNSGIEMAIQNDARKDVEIEDFNEKVDRKAENEKNWRRSSLFNATNINQGAVI